MSEVLGAFEGTTPLRRPLPTRRRKRSGVPALLLGALLRAVLLVGVPVAIVVWLLYSPYFLIREVRVEGGSRVAAAWVEENLRPLARRHILGVSLDGVRRRLSAHPWVASVALRRELPDRLRVTVVERQPAALLARDGGLLFLDAAGEPIAPAPAGGAEGLLVVHSPFGDPAPVAEVLDVVAELQRADAAWGLGVREVTVLGEGEFRLASEPLPFPLLVKAGEVAEGVANLRQVLPEVTRRWRGIGSVDLRQPRRLVVQHAGEVPPAPPVATPPPVVVTAPPAPEIAAVPWPQSPLPPSPLAPEIVEEGGEPLVLPEEPLLDEAPLAEPDEPGEPVGPRPTEGSPAVASRPAGGRS